MTHHYDPLYDVKILSDGRAVPTQKAIDAADAAAKAATRRDKERERRRKQQTPTKEEHNDSTEAIRTKKS